MTLHADLGDLFASTVVISTPTARDRYGVETWSTGTSYKAHVSMGHTEIRNQNGDVTAASGTVILNTTVWISTGCRVTLPDGSRPPVQNVTRYFDEVGHHHTTLQLGR